MHPTPAWHKGCQRNAARLDRGWASGPPRWRLRPAPALARSREAVHAHAVVSRAGSGLSGGKSREIGGWDDSREEGSGVGEGGGTWAAAGLCGFRARRARGSVAKRVSWCRRLPEERGGVPPAGALRGPRALGTHEPLRPPGPWGPRPAAAGRPARGLSSLCERPLPRGGGGGGRGLCVGLPAEGPRRGTDRASAV